LSIVKRSGPTYARSMERAIEKANLQIHLCVCGGIAAYKAVELTSALKKRGHAVHVAMTESAQSFVGALTFQAMTGHDVFTSLLDPTQEGGIGHIEFAQNGSVLVVAPATANMISKAALGLGDELVSTILLAANIPIIFAPAMNTEMWRNPAIQSHVQTLRLRGHTVMEPDSGLLACGAVGPGRLPEVEGIIEVVESVCTEVPQDLVNHRVMIAGGPTREYLDPVRFLSNPSSGKTAVALAQEAAGRGAEVTLIMGPGAASHLNPHPKVTRIDVISAQDMHSAVMNCVGKAEILIMSAAVSDWTPANPSLHKRKKTGETQSMEMVRTLDILAALGAHSGRDSFTLVGFAAETEQVIDNARDKRLRKNADIIIANDVSDPTIGFGSDENAIVLVTPKTERAVPRSSKPALAHIIFDTIVAERKK
jgi:phosphopantothenoylcysteine decarboxylase / phosphopantothenate---cysteine ligase